MLRSCFCFVMFLTGFGAFTQDTTSPEFSIKGRIMNDQSKPVGLANITLYNKQDSASLKNVVSDEKGNFLVSVRPGIYFLRISFQSFEDKLIPDLAIADKDLDVGTVQLMTKTKTLQEVVVTSEKSQMKLELDKRVFNVSKDINNIGLNASDILNNIPSVIVDVDGTVSLRGSDNVKILINGKPSALAGTRRTDALRHLQGSLIESIEVITNPSSRYEAAGEVGIINIILKKNKVRGLNGTVITTAGYPEALGSSFNINYRKDKINLFSSYGINHNSTPGRGESQQKFTSGDTSFSYTQNRKINRSEVAHNLVAGLDYYLDDNNTITGSFIYSPSDGINKSRIEYLDYDEAGHLQQTVVRNEKESEVEKSIEGSLNFRRRFKGNDHQLTADLKFVLDDDIETTDYHQDDPVFVKPLIQRAYNAAKERDYLFQADYIRPLGEDAKIETGLRTNTRIIKNLYSLEQQDDQGNWIALPAFKNNMIYTERIHAVYVMGSKKIKRFAMQGGLRGEISDITTELMDTKEVNNRTYFNIFPSANLSYELNDYNTLQLSYSYRINRPRFRDLLPFSDFSDLRSFFKGNPDLNPEFTHAFEAGHLLDWEKGNLLSNIYYRHTSGEIERITAVDTNGIAYIFPVNLATENSYGIEFNLNHAIAKWWRVTSSLNLFRAVTKGDYNGENFYSDTYSSTARATSKMTFFKKWDFQLALNYRGPRATPQGEYLTMYFIDLGISGDILKGQGTLTFNLRDLLNTRMRRSIVNDEGYYSKSEFQWRSRQALFTFSYRLNRVKEEGEKSEESNEEPDF